MAGHSKFKNIMHRKGAQDKKRAAMFSKLSREITVAAKMGMPDPDMNPRLRLAVNAAKHSRCPRTTSSAPSTRRPRPAARTISRCATRLRPGRVALIVEALTDNRNRTATNVRTAFSKNGGNLGSEGSVSHGFERRGLIEYSASVGDEEKVLEAPSKQARTMSKAPRTATPSGPPPTRSTGLRASSRRCSARPTM